MALTYSQWIWGFEVLDSGFSQNNKLDFKDGVTTYQGATAATLNAGVYSADEFAFEVQRAMRAQTLNTNQGCTFDYSTLRFTVSGAGTFQLLFFNTWPDAAIDCNGLLGFSAAVDKTGATSYVSDAVVGTLPSAAFLWIAAEPLNYTSPVTATSAGTPAVPTAALLTQRAVITIQHISDGGTVESVYISTIKKVQIAFRCLLPAEQASMEKFLDWSVQGKRFTWQPDKTSVNALKLVLANPGQINPMFEYLTRAETSYGMLTFFEQLS